MTYRSHGSIEYDFSLPLHVMQHPSQQTAQSHQRFGCPEPGRLYRSPTPALDSARGLPGTSYGSPRS